MNAIRKTVTAGFAALTLAGATLAPSPAAAKPYWKNNGGAFAGALVGGLVLGAIASAAANDYDCTYGRQPVLDDDGYIIGYRRVRICN